MKTQMTLYLQNVRMSHVQLLKNNKNTARKFEKLQTTFETPDAVVDEVVEHEGNDHILTPLK